MKSTRRALHHTSTITSLFFPVGGSLYYGQSATIRAKRWSDCYMIVDHANLMYYESEAEVSPPFWVPWVFLLRLPLCVVDQEMYACFCSFLL